MLSAITMAYVLAVVAFAAGVGLAVRLATADGVDESRGAFWYLLLIPGVAGVAYVAIALGIGSVSLGTGTLVVPRYVDWLVTTPVLVGYVGYVAGAPRRWVVGVMVADAMMILTGAGATLLAGPAKWSLFAVSACFHISLFGALYVVFPRYARQQGKRHALFELLQNHVGLLWLAYPLVWLVGAPGLGYVSAASVSLIVAYLDVVAKVPYIYFVWKRRFVFDADASVLDTRPGRTGAAAAPGGPADD